MKLRYQGDVLESDVIELIVNKAAEYDILPSLLIVQLHLESMWGRSNVARQDNNLGGISVKDYFTGTRVRPSGIQVTLGSKRPASEGGYYYRYASIPDFIDDWTFLLRPGGIYKVSGQTVFEEAVKGLFRAGGAQYDYAASGYASYLSAMVSRYKRINIDNGYALEKLDQEFLGGNGMATAQKVLNEARRWLGTTKYSGRHNELLAIYNAIRPLPAGYAVKPADDWCDMFVSAIAKKAGAGNLIGYECGVERHKNIFKQKGIWNQLRPSGNSFQPRGGDIVIFHWGGQRGGFAHHIGFVESVDGDYITTIEGNTVQGGKSCVGRNRFHKYDHRIQGYARPKYGSHSSGGQTTTKPVDDAIARDVLNGKHGNGTARVASLRAAGYDPIKVQERVNALMAEENKKKENITYTDIAKEVIDGKHGNGEERIRRLKAAGYNPQKVQERVNWLLNQQQQIQQAPKQDVGGKVVEKLKDNEIRLDGVIYQVIKK